MYVHLKDDKKVYYLKLGEDDPSWVNKHEYKIYSQNENPYVTAAGFTSTFDGKDVATANVCISFFYLFVFYSSLFYKY